jgi:hypothetical protein
VLEASGFDEIHFKPFRIPIDLPAPPDGAASRRGFEALNTHTVRLENGERVMYRGALAQPWCHLVARRGRG